MTPSNELLKEVEHYRERYRQLEVDNARLKEENARLKEENAKMREELLSLKTTVTAVVARSIDAKADSTSRKRYKKSGRKDGHEGASRVRSQRVDETVELDQPTCPSCGGVLSEKPTDAYTRVVEDIVPARVVVTEYVVKRRYCCTCRTQVSPEVPNLLGNNERFGLRLMLLIVSLKLLGMSYEKIGSLLKLLFNLHVTEAAMLNCVTSVADAFGRRYSELRDELRREGSVHGDETGWRIKGRNHWLWAFIGKWSVIYEVARSRGKSVPRSVLGRDYPGTVISDSFSAWNHVGKRHQRCLVHYLREIADTIKYKSPGQEFVSFAKKLRRVFKDAIRTVEKVEGREDRLRAKERLEARVDALIPSYSSSGERNCRRFLKRLRRERGMLFMFLEEDGVDWNNNAAERALRSSVVIRKITYGNQSDEGARAHAVLMSIRETCNLRKENFFDYAMGYLNPTSER